MAYSVNVPAVVIFPMLWPENSVNHTAPSGPAVIPHGLLPAVGTEYSVTGCAAAAGAGSTAQASAAKPNPYAGLAIDEVKRIVPTFMCMIPIASFKPTAFGPETNRMAQPVPAEKTTRDPRRPSGARTARAGFAGCAMQIDYGKARPPKARSCCRFAPRDFGTSSWQLRHQIYDRNLSDNTCGSRAFSTKRSQDRP